MSPDLGFDHIIHQSCNRKERERKAESEDWNENKGEEKNDAVGRCSPLACTRYQVYLVTVLTLYSSPTLAC